MKKDITFLHRAAGIVLGLALSAVLLFTAFVRVLYNRDYYLTQDVRYGIINKTDLKNTDEYAKIYRGIINALKNKGLKGYSVQFIGDETEYCSLYVDEGAQETKKESQNYSFSFLPPEKFVHTVESIKGYTNPGSWFEVGVVLPTTVDYNVRVHFFVENIRVSAIIDGREVDAAGNVTVSEASGKSAEDFTENEVKQGRGGSLKIYIDRDIFDEPEKIEEIRVSFDMYSPDELNVRCQYKLFGGKTAEDSARTVGGDWAEAFTAEETGTLNALGKKISAVKTAVIIFAVAAVIFAVFVIVKDRKKSLLGMGIYVLAVAAAAFIAVNVFTRVMPTETLVNVFNAAADKGLFLPNIMTNEFMRDYLDGARRFFDFLCLIPLFAGYVMISISRRKKADPNEDYMYQ